MLGRASHFIGNAIAAKDGDIGTISDILFDEEEWTLRWVVADTGSWLPGRKVLLPPSAFGKPDTTGTPMPVALTREQIENSPGSETDEPVSRQQESRLFDYYGGAPYWTTGYVAPVGAAGMPLTPVPSNVAELDRARTMPEPDGDQHLRSANEVTGYYIRANDGEIGHVEDFLLETGGSWAIRYLMIDTKNWWPGKFVLVSPRWIRSISWSEGEVQVDLTQDQIKESPEFDPSEGVERHYEDRLHRHYGLPPYWS